MRGVTVVCVYRPGGGFTNEYPLRLKRAVDEHSGVHTRFVCLTNQRLPGVECVPLVKGWKGWWNKLEVFRRGLFSGPVVYLDLDTMLLRSVSDIFAAQYRFACVTNWEGPGTHINSTLMAWDADEDFSYITDEFSPALSAKYEKSWERWGDQGFIQDQLRTPFESLIERYPGRIVSYKQHVRPNGGVPADASIVCFHGQPRPHQVNWDLSSVN